VIRGSCHCGNIQFDLDWAIPDEGIPVRKCSCTFCVKHGSAWTSNLDGERGIAIGDASLVSQYRFGTRTADFNVCTVCGIVPVVTCRIDGRDYAVVNVNTFEHRDKLSFAESPSNFDGEGTDSRLERRKRNWISRVHIKTLVAGR